MSDLVAITYPDLYKAGQALDTLQRMQTQYLLDMDDAVTVTKELDGKVKLHQTREVSGGKGAGWGALWGTLIGALFFMPVAGAAVGAAVGGASAAGSDYGIDNNFMKELSQQMQPGTSALFVLVRNVTTDKVVPEVAKYGGTVIRTSLPADAEARLSEALAKGDASSK